MKITRYIRSFYYRYMAHVQKGKCLFIPHDGFCLNDKASIKNYKADNCLIFVRYLLDKGLYQDKELVVISTTPENAAKEQEFCKQKYPDANIRIIPGIANFNKGVFRAEWSTSEYIIESEMKFIYPQKESQKYISLSYYPISLKNDCYCEITKHKGYRAQQTQKPDYAVSSSLVNSQIDAAANEMPFYKFIPIGKVRSDILLEKEDVTFVREYLQKQAGECKFNKIILYTPTHRDYERSTFDIKRSILGFDVNKDKFEQFLHQNGLLIVCKLHPFQNSQVVDTTLPKGVVNFTGTKDFGLIELMKASDMLMTDYTSTYIDYLLLNKPVIFNFYDKDIYEKTRGLAFYPYEKICAGEIFTDEESFYRAVEATLQNPDKYANMRRNVTEHLNTYHKDVCKKTYKLIFDD